LRKRFRLGNFAEKKREKIIHSDPYPKTGGCLPGFRLNNQTSFAPL
jgi:hypothetical protein